MVTDIISISKRTNGVLFTNGNGPVNIDGTDGYVMGFDFGYIQADFPSINNAISVDEAKKRTVINSDLSWFIVHMLTRTVTW